MRLMVSKGSLFIVGAVRATFRLAGQPYPFRRGNVPGRGWPGRVGSNDFLLRLMAGDGSLPRAKEAMLALSLPERGIETAGAQGGAGRGRLLGRF